MKEPFKIGQRVAIYNSSDRQIGEVLHIYDDQTMNVQLDGDHEFIFRVHVKQCRRLKRKSKKAREWWIDLNDNRAYTSNWSGFERIHVKEVLPTTPKVRNAFSGKSNAQVAEMIGNAFGYCFAMRSRSDKEMDSQLGIDLIARLGLDAK